MLTKIEGVVRLSATDIVMSASRVITPHPRHVKPSQSQGSQSLADSS